MPLVPWACDLGRIYELARCGRPVPGSAGLARDRSIWPEYIGPRLERCHCPSYYLWRTHIQTGLTQHPNWFGDLVLAVPVALVFCLCFSQGHSNPTMKGHPQLVLAPARHCAGLGCLPFLDRPISLTTAARPRSARWWEIPVVGKLHRGTPYAQCDSVYRTFSCNEPRLLHVFV